MNKLNQYDILDILTRLDCLDIIADGKARDFPATSSLQREHTTAIRKKLLRASLSGIEVEPLPAPDTLVRKSVLSVPATQTEMV